MENQFSLQVNKPCSEKFNSFKPTEKGGFCNSCAKEVVDFTGMTSQEVINYFTKNNSTNTCGQFKQDQLTSYTGQIPKTKRYSYLSAIALAVFSFFSLNNLQAQEVKDTEGKNSIKIKNDQKTINVKGTVVDESGPLPGVSILLQGTHIGTETDFDGNFKFPQKLKKGDILVFSFLGMESKKIVINNKKSVSKIELKVDMKMSSCILMGKVAVKKVYSSKNK